jgi:hypothetical protein
MDPARLPLLMDLIAIETHAIRLSRQQPSQRDLREILTFVREALNREMAPETVAQDRRSPKSVPISGL